MLTIKSGIKGPTTKKGTIDARSKLIIFVYGYLKS